MTPPLPVLHRLRFAPAIVAAMLVLARPAVGAINTDVIISRDSSSSLNNITTPAFSTAAGNELLLAFVSTDAASPGIRVTSITGGGLSWVLVQRTNVQLGTAEIWRAFSPAVLSNVTVRANYSSPVPASLTVVSFTGVDITGTNGSGAIGATGTGNANPGAPTASLLTTRNQSWVWGVGTDWDRGIPRTLGSGQVMVHEYLATVGDTYWVWRRTSTTPASGTSVTLNATAPTNDRYNVSIVEILPPAGPSYSISGTVSPLPLGAGTLLTLSPSGATTTADAGGNFSFPGLQDGMYTVTPSKAGTLFTPASQSVTVAGADMPGVNFTAAPAPTYILSGTISGAFSGALLTLGGAATRTTNPDGSGNYSFTGLVAGTYTVTPSKAGYNFTPASQTVPITNASVGNINFAAAVAPGPPINYPDLSDFVPAGGIAIVGSGASRVFQYTHLTFNGGSGPLNILPSYNSASGNYLGRQLLWTFNAGSWTQTQQPPIAGAFVFHPPHGHFHFPFSRYGLYAVAADGGIGGPVILSEKIGFCIHDSYLYDPTLPNAGALNNLGSCADPTSIQGLNIGAVDEYDRTDPGQSISLVGIPDGTYWLRAIVDPDNYLHESNENNNETDVKLTITGNAVQVLQTVSPVLPPLPTITLDTPLGGATVAGTVNLTATTSATTAVYYFLNGDTLAGPVFPAPYTFPWNSATVPNGTHWLAAQTTDANGRTNTSPVAIVTVANGTGPDMDPPVVTITDPSGGDTVFASVTVTATATDQSPITSFQLFVDGNLLGPPLASPPYLVTWNTASESDGPHTLTAQATDSGNRTGTSPPVVVVVDNSHPPDVITKDVTAIMNGRDLITTNPFSTAVPGDYLVAFVGYDGPTNVPQTAAVNGAGLTWTLLKRSNTQFGTSEIWGARAAGLLTNVTVSSLPGITGFNGSLCVIAFTHCAGPGVVGQAGAPTGEPDIFLPGVAAGSWVFAVGNDWEGAVARTPVSGQVLVHQWLDTAVGDTYWVQSTTAPSTAFGLVTIHDSAPNNHRWNYAAVEMVATRSTGGNTRPTVSIQAPSNNAFYFTGQTIQLTGTAGDLESPVGALDIRWAVDLIFGSHTQTGYATFTGLSASYPGANVDNGTGVRQRIRFWATDPGGLVSDTARVTIWPEIDLAPSAMTVTPDPPVAGQSAQVAFSVNNTGRMPAALSRWALRAGNTVLAQGDVAVAGNGQANLSPSVVFPSAGNLTLRLTVDSLGVVFETNEANNVGTRALTVNAPPGPPPTAFPRTPVLDTFNRSNGAIGLPWVDQTAVFRVVSQTLGPGTNDAYIEWNGATYGAAQEVFVKLSTVAATGREHNLMLKTQGTTWSSGHIEVSYSASTSQIFVYTFTPPGTWATRGQINGVSFAAGNQFGARALADGTVQVYKNGALLGSVSVAGWPYAALGGRIGLSVARSGAARFDDFGGGTVPDGAVFNDPPLDEEHPAEAPPTLLHVSDGVPNPSSGSIAFAVELPTADEVTLSVFDIQGREVWRGPVESFGAGRWSLTWDGRTRDGQAPAGVYLARLRVGNDSVVRRITILH